MSAPEDVALWLEGLKLSRYAAAFEAAGYDDASMIPELDEKDLDAIGVELPGHRKRLLINGRREKERGGGSGRALEKREREGGEER